MRCFRTKTFPQLSSRLFSTTDRSYTVMVCTFRIEENGAAVDHHDDAWRHFKTSHVVVDHQAIAVSAHSLLTTYNSSLLVYTTDCILLTVFSPPWHAGPLVRMFPLLIVNKEFTVSVLGATVVVQRDAMPLSPPCKDCVQHKCENARNVGLARLYPR